MFSDSSNHTSSTGGQRPTKPSGPRSSHQPPAEGKTGEASAVISSAGKAVSPLARRPLVAALIGALLLWVSMPPLGWWPLAWVALIPFIILIASPSLPRRAYRSIWLASWIYWAGTMYFIPIPHWALWFGWFALALYLSLYLPCFLAVARLLVHRWRFPTPIAAAIAWVGMEYVRANFLTGFGMVMLGHSQFRIPVLIQIIDVAGGYGLSFLIVLFNGLLWRGAFSGHAWPSRAWSLATALALVGLVVAYGQYRLPSHQLADQSDDRFLRVGILQGNIDTVFPKTPEEQAALERKKIDQYRQLASSQDFRKPVPGLRRSSADLLVWPEGKFPLPEYFIKETSSGAAGLQSKLYNSSAEFAYVFKAMQSAARLRGDPADAQLDTRVLPSVIGTSSIDVSTEAVYNSALLVDVNGVVQDRYLKMHRVMFGEYVPLENWIPALRHLTPSGRSLTRGRQPAALQFREFTIAPNICFESCVAHLIRRQVNHLATEGREPDFLFNLSDDGWFYGTSCLDFHLACNVFRAVEMRKPTIVAANTGLSAEIDGSGVIRQRGPRRQLARLHAEISPDGRASFYRSIGDWPAFILTALLVLAAVERGFYRIWRIWRNKYWRKD